MAHTWIWRSRWVLAFWLLAAQTGRTQVVPPPPPAELTGGTNGWHEGFVRYDFLMDEASHAITPYHPPAGERFGVKEPPKGQRRAIVVVPRQAAAGRPWSWRGCYWDHEPQTEVELLRRGFHVVFVTPDPGPAWDAWYDWLTTRHGLAAKPAFIGMSKGGVNEYDWTTTHPDRVACIYADNPAIRPAAFAQLEALARNDVALLHVCGSQDFLLQRHTLPLENRYLEFGGQITVLIKDGAAHHPHSLRDPKFIADWIESHVRPAAEQRPDFLDPRSRKSYYYSRAATNVFLSAEKTFANCRGPGFTPVYERYDVPAESQWGLTGLAVIVPREPAPGKPWLFRADAVDRDAAIEQALLARGWHIVIAPLTAQAGAVPEQWEAAYQMLVAHGFSRRPVVAGTGTGAGEAYAWAIAHPERVAAVYGRNPALRSLSMSGPERPLDHLAALAQAGVPLLHVCDAADPWFETQTKVAAERYGALGGRLTVVRNPAGFPGTVLAEAAAGEAAGRLEEAIAR